MEHPVKTAITHDAVFSAESFISVSHDALGSIDPFIESCILTLKHAIRRKELVQSPDQAINVIRPNSSQAMNENDSDHTKQAPAMIVTK
jgi:hypothetical protein